MPNPNTGNFIISYDLPQNTSGTLQIMDVMGKEVYCLSGAPCSVLI